MTIDDWPEWLPADWVIQISKINEKKVKCFIDPKGQKFYSKPQVDRHLKTIKPNNVDAPTLDLSLEPEELETNEEPESTPKGQTTRPRRSASSGKKYKEPEDLFGGDEPHGSSSVRRSGSGRKEGDSNWLPEGWTVDVKSKKSGQKYKIFTSPNGKKLFSKPQVLSYLANTNSKEAKKTPGKSKISEPTEVEKEETPKITESTPIAPNYEVISSTPADGLPPGWIKEIRMRTHGSSKKKDPYYIDPLSGYVFSSKLDALRYLDTGDITKCATKPTRVDTNQETTEGELATPSEPTTKEPETPKPLQNGSVTESKPEGTVTEKRKVRSITTDGQLPMPMPVSSVSSQKGEKEDWLPEGWIVEMKYREEGKKVKCYKELATGKNCYSKPQVFTYLGLDLNGIKTPNSNSGKRKVKRKSYVDSSPDSGSEDFAIQKKTKNDSSNVQETIVTTPAEGLPPGWIKEVRHRVSNGITRKDPYYIDPVSGYVFRSKLDALRYLETGDVNLCAMRPRMRDADGNEVAIPDTRPKPKHHRVLVEGEDIGKDKEVENSDTNPKNTPDSTPGSGSVRRGTRERVPAKSKTSPSPAAPTPARTSTRVKATKPNTKTDASDENALQPEMEAARVNLEKQSGDVEQLDYQLEDDSSWTDQFDFAVKTLVGEFPPSEGGGVGNGDGSPAKGN